MLRNIIVLPDGTELCSGTGATNAIQSVSLTECVNGGTDLTLGSVCCAMLEAKLITPEGGLQIDAEDEITVYTEDEDGTRHQMGLFSLEKPTRPSAHTMSITAYDRVSWLDRDLSQWLADLKEWPYSLFALAQMVCAACGLEFANEELPNGSFLVQQFSAAGITGRQLMQWIGQAAGRFCRATVDGRLEFAWYENGSVSIGPTSASVSVEGVAAQLEDVPAGVTLLPVTKIQSDQAAVESITLKCQGKNLLDLSSIIGTSTTASGGTLTCGADGGITGSGTPTGSVSFYGFKLNIPKTTITMSTSGTYTNMSFVVYLRDAESKSLAAFGITASGTSKTINLADYPEYSYIGLELKRNANNVEMAGTMYPQIELGNKATAHALCCGQTYTVLLPQGVMSGSYDWNSGLLTMDTDEKIQLESFCISALEGINVLYSDCGDTAVSYRQLGYYQNSLKYEDYAVAPIEKVQIHLTDTDVGAVYPDVEGGNTYQVTGNYLLTTEDTQALTAVAQTLYEQLKDVTYTPCQVTVPAQLALKPGQILTVTDRNGHSFRTYIMSRTMAAHRDTLKSTGSAHRGTSGAVNNRRYEALSGRVLELSAQVEGLRAENRDAAHNAASLELAVEGIKAEVSRQESDADTLKQQMTTLEQNARQVQLTVQSMQQEGVSKVTTQTGFTFDEEGLHISKTGSDLENALTEKGLQVVRNKGTAYETTMLQADADGVTATDVSVRNYLIVGNARFEEYTGGRTACFYYGGTDGTTE